MAATTPRKRKVEKKSERVGDFVFTTSEGATVTVPPFSILKPGFIRKIRKLDEADQFFSMLEEVVAIRRQQQVDAKREELEAEAEPGVEVTDREVRKHLDHDDTLDIIDDLESDEFQEFQAGWFEHSGVNLGE